ncbi:MAG: hypothetical protein IKU01_03800 [Bacteroidales bacterium]|nr:hypothetical protein [Bacteroidales bacterium]
MKKIILTLIIFVLALFRGTAQENAAKSAMAEGDYQAAIKLYQVAIATCNDESKSADLYNSITTAQKCEELLIQADEAYKKKKYSEAKKLYQSILKYNPSDKFSKKRVSLCSNNTSQSKQEKQTVQHEYVDLGLSVKWATCNVGASKPEDYGNKYAWGETKTKTEYTKSNSTTHGKYMKDIKGDAQYDAATANWGDNWRMPTGEEFKELINKCTWTYTTQDGKSGYKVTGPNGNSIFLSGTDYWSGSTNYRDVDNQYSGYFSSKNMYYTAERFNGKLVRPVYDKNVKSNNATSQQNSTNVQSTTSQQNSTNVQSTTSQQNSTNVQSTTSQQNKSNTSTQNTTKVSKPSNGTANGYEYVDLGLPSGLKWATCNVGAKSPEKPGHYFAWGETISKLSYPYNGGNYGKFMNDFSGDKKHDAARAKWGGNWRTPTTDEFRELLDKCTWENTKVNGKYGYKVTGPNGNSIFLPAAGYMTSKSNNGVGSCGHYWTSTPPRYTDMGTQLLFDNLRPRLWGENSRGEGASIRPVIE